jgi:hypothetical protein
VRLTVANETRRARPHTSHTVYKMMRCRFYCSVAGAHRALQSEKVVGNTVEKIRSLIAVPPEIEAVLRAYSACYPEDRASVEQALEFRRRVGEEFEPSSGSRCRLDFPNRQERTPGVERKSVRGKKAKGSTKRLSTEI